MCGHCSRVLGDIALNKIQKFLPSCRGEKGFKPCPVLIPEPVFFLVYHVSDIASERIGWEGSGQREGEDECWKEEQVYVWSRGKKHFRR